MVVRGRVVRVGFSPRMRLWDPIRVWLVVLFVFALVDLFSR
jgi:hypothetical protein